MKEQIQPQLEQQCNLKQIVPEYWMNEWYKDEREQYGPGETYPLPENVEKGVEKEIAVPTKNDYQPFLEQQGEGERDSFISHLKELDAKNRMGLVTHATIASINAPIAILNVVAGNYWAVPVNLAVTAMNAYLAHRAYEGKYGEDEEVHDEKKEDLTKTPEIR